jgi:predicted phosphate transport protein (TIGR00153 family)
MSRSGIRGLVLSIQQIHHDGFFMLKISSLFGRSPFAPLQSHMESVSHCVHRLPDLFEALEKNDSARIEKIAEEISQLEHDADLIKNDIRNHLPKSIFLPIDRGNLLEILSIQDSIADKAEDVAVLITLKPLELLPIFKDEFKLFLHKNIETFDEAKLIIKELHELLESSFGGIEAEKVRAMVDEVAYREHEADLIQRQLLKSLFKAEDQLTYITFHLWQRLFESIAAISNYSENLAYRIRMTLELK